MNSIPKHKLAILGFCFLLVKSQEVAGFAQEPLRSKGIAKTTPPTTSAEGNVLAIARERGINVLMDSTSIAASITPEEIDPATRGPQTDIVNVLGPCAQSFHLSSQRLSPDTFVYWAEPNERDIALAVARGEGFGAEKGELSLAQVKSRLFAHFHPEEAAQRALEAQKPAPTTLEEFKARRKEQQQPIPVDVQDFELSQLPTDLQQQLVASVLGSGPGVPIRDYGELWLRPETWQKARLIYSPNDPKDKETYKTLVLKSVVENQGGRFEVSLNALMGAFFVKALKPARLQDVTAPTAIPGGNTAEATLRLLSIDEPVAGAKPLTVNDVLRPQGTALKSLRGANPNQYLSGEAELAVKVSGDATRQTLRQFLREVSKLSNIALQLPVDAEADKLLISAHVEEMPLAQLMGTLAHLYGRDWTKVDAKTFTLVIGTRSPFEMQLQRAGYFQSYRFRENNASAFRKRTANFYQLAARLFDETGNGLASPVGVAFTSLAPESQQELREYVEKGVIRRIVMRQLDKRDLREGQWSFRLVTPASASGGFSTKPTLVLLLDGQPQLPAY